MPVEAVRYGEGVLELVDQTLLPHEFKLVRIESVAQLCEAIRMLRVRGAPAIGVAAAYGFALVVDLAEESGETDLQVLRRRLEDAGAALAATRPTARNLFMAVERMLAVVRSNVGSARQLAERVRQAACALHEEDRGLCLAIARHGAALLPQTAKVLTHCNAGALATGGIGTALGVVYEAVRQGKTVEVYADETRPLLQGARLTAWELGRAGIPVTLLCDNAAASLLSRGRIDCVIVGADRIARNGDTANKIGTLAVALAAQRFGVPFYVAAPSTTFDLGLESGADIPIEQRSAHEVSDGFGARTAPDGVGVFNPAFDVTPGELIAAIIHERGIVRAPYAETIASSLA